MPATAKSLTTEDTFHWISTILSMMLGLPLAWAGIGFLAMIQVW